MVRWCVKRDGSTHPDDAELEPVLGEPGSRERHPSVPDIEVGLFEQDLPRSLGVVAPADVGTVGRVDAGEGRAHLHLVGLEQGEQRSIDPA